jgi:hypothetical protein
MDRQTLTMVFKAAVLSVILLLSHSACHKEKSDAPQNTIDKASVPVPPVNYIFVGAEKESPKLYQYNSETGKADVYWGPSKGTISGFEYNENYTKAFITTVSSAGKLGAFPFINNVTIFILDVKSKKIEKVKNFGSGIQMIAYWQDTATVRLVMNVIDKTIATYVEQKSALISSSAKILFEENKTYDLAKSGYPLMPVVKPQIVAPAGGFSLNVTENNEVFLRKPGKKQLKLIGGSAFKLHRAAWSPDKKYVVLSTLNISPANETLYDAQPATANIYIYSIEDETIVYQNKGAGLKNFNLVYPFVFFDDGFSTNAAIRIFNLQTRELAPAITMPGGCGIINIPFIPDYGA